MYITKHKHTQRIGTFFNTNYVIHIMIEETWKSSAHDLVYQRSSLLQHKDYRESHGHQFRYLLRPVRFVWFSLGQRLSWALNNRGTLKDTPTSTQNEVLFSGLFSP